MVLHDTDSHSAQKAGLEGTGTTFTPHGDQRFKPEKIKRQLAASPLVYGKLNYERKQALTIRVNCRPERTCSPNPLPSASSP